MEERLIERRFEAIDKRFLEVEHTLDNHLEVLKELSEQSDKHTQAFAKVSELLDAHTESISALQADVSSIKATQSDHGEMLREHGKRFDGVEVLLREILRRLPEKGKE